MKEKFHKTSRSLEILGPQLCAIFSFAVNAFTNKSKFRKQLLLAEKHFIFLKKHPRSNLKVKQVELNQKSSNFSHLTCLFNNGLSLVTSKDSLIRCLNLCDS